MKLLRTSPKARLAARALVAAGAAAVAAYLKTGHISQAMIVGGALAFCEVFTPLNVAVGYFKNLG